MKTCLKASVAGLILALALVLPAQAATDIQGHWAAVPVDYAESQGLVAGYPDGTFQPDATISRAEFVAIGNRLFQPETGAPMVSQYGDIAGHWAQGEIERAESGAILGALAGEGFMPDQAIQRQEVAALLDAYLGTNQTEANLSVLNAYTDQGAISSGFEGSLASLIQQDLMSGYPDGSLGPDKPITRAEAVALFLRATDQEPVAASLDRVVPTIIDGKEVLRDQENGAILRRVQVADPIIQLGDLTYAIADDGTLVYGFVQAPQGTVYSEGVMGLARGWRQIDSDYYYFQPYDYTMLKDGPRATYPGVFLFGADGKVTSGNFFSGYPGKNVYFAPPSPAEMTNDWIQSPDGDRIAKGQAIVNYAAARQGLPFKWFGADLNDPSGVYCCGAAYSAYKAFGILMPGPEDVNVRDDRGYAMVRAQYLRAEEFGGVRIPQDYSQIWPGDIAYSGSARQPYAHAALYLGMNNGRPIVAHATLADGFVIEPEAIITSVWGYHHLDTIRYV